MEILGNLKQKFILFYAFLALNIILIYFLMKNEGFLPQFYKKLSGSDYTIVDK